MRLNSDQLEAFETVAKHRNFTLAAAELSITQPALTRRIQALESKLGASLFVRKATGSELTEAGLRLLRHAQATRVMEDELNHELNERKNESPGGLVRIAGYSSVLHALITPALSNLLRKFEKIQVHYQATQDVRPAIRQSEMLTRSDTDFLLSVTDFGNREIVSHLLGYQELVAVESSKYRSRQDVYLDTRPEDQTTFEFLKAQGESALKISRSFFHDEEGILNAVAEGMGRGVVFKFLIRKQMPVRAIKGFKALYWPIYLHYRQQAIYSRTITEVKDAILGNATETLPQTKRK